MLEMRFQMSGLKRLLKFDMFLNGVVEEGRIGNWRRIWLGFVRPSVWMVREKSVSNELLS